MNTAQNNYAPIENCLFINGKKYFLIPAPDQQPLNYPVFVAGPGGNAVPAYDTCANAMPVNCCSCCGQPLPAISYAFVPGTFQACNVISPEQKQAEIADIMRRTEALLPKKFS